MNEDQLRIASDAVAAVVRDAVCVKDRPDAAALKKLAEDAAEAVAAGFAKLSAPPAFDDGFGARIEQTVRSVLRIEKRPGGLLA